MYISVSLSCAAEINTCKPTILQKFKKKILIIKKKKNKKKTDPSQLQQILNPGAQHPE